MFQLKNEVDLMIRDGLLVDIDGTVLAPAGGFAGLGNEFEARDLEGERDQFGEFRYVGVFLMEHEHDLLGDVFGDLPPITRCREG